MSILRFAVGLMNPDRAHEGPKMKVIAAGLPRCATSSLQDALDKLGFDPCMHMAHVSPHAHRQVLVTKAVLEQDAHKRRKLLHEIFDGYQASSDFPGFYFIDDMMDMYPDAAIILNQRKGGAKPWVKSVEDVFGFFMTWWFYWICFFYKTDRMQHNIVCLVRKESIKKFGAPVPSVEIYDLFQEFVLAEAKKRNRPVLIWQPEEGWAPICKFLNKPAPEGPFPHVNDTNAMRFFQNFLLVRGVVTWGLFFGGIYAAVQYGPGVVQNVMNMIN